MMTTLNREIERQNKQLTRLKKQIRTAGSNLSDYIEQGRQKHITRAGANLSKKELIKKYSDVIRRSDLTSMSKIDKQKTEMRKDLNLSPNAPVSPEQLSRYRNAVNRANATSALYYQAMTRAVDTGLFESEADANAYYRESKLDSDAAVNDLMEKIEEAEYKGKQSRSPEEVAQTVEQLELELRAEARNWELTIGEKRRGRNYLTKRRKK